MANTPIVEQPASAKFSHRTGTELTLVHSLLSNEDSARAHEGGWDGALRKLMRRFPTTLEVS